MNPYENHADQMIAVAKILGRLYIDGHISGDELVVLQSELMHFPEPLPVISHHVHNPPVTIWGGTYPPSITIPFGGSIGVSGNGISGNGTSYTTLGLSNVNHFTLTNPL
jgi:hypothetical protein